VVGEVQLVDFVQAFSHWVYEYTHHVAIVCDLQGILDMEGKRPLFRLTDPAICSKDNKRNRYCYGKTDLVWLVSVNFAVNTIVTMFVRA